MKKIISLLIVFLLVCSMAGCGKDKNLEKYEATLYFSNSAKTDLSAETREIKYKSSEKLEEKVMEELLKGPTSKELVAIIPNNAELLSVNIEDDGVAVCNFTPQIYSSVETDNLLIRFTILRTLTSLEGIKGVKLLVNSGPYIGSDGLEIGVMNSEDVVYDTEPEYGNDEEVELYYADKNGQKLIAEKRKISISPKESVEMRIVKELIKGPESDSLVKTIPEETKILSVETKEGVCFVNLSQEFITRHIGGSGSEMLTVYSIVNSLTQLDNVYKVQFLIEGQKTEVYIQMIFNEPFIRNETIIG